MSEAQTNKRLVEHGLTFVGEAPSLGAKTVYTKEKWIIGTKLLAFLFVIHKDNLTKEDIIQGFEGELLFARKNKKTWLFRGFCAYVIIPLYITKNPSKEVIETVDKQYRKWAILYRPIVFDEDTKKAYFEREVKFTGVLIWTFAQEIVTDVVASLTETLNLTDKEEDVDRKIKRLGKEEKIS